MVVLTGAKGFVGARLKKTLESMDYEVFAVDRSKVNVYSFKDLLDYILSNAKGPFEIIHCGAVSDIKDCEKNKTEAYKANVVYTQNLAHIAADFGSRIIFLSSDQVYDYFNKKEHTEMGVPCPSNYYGMTKLWAENIIKEICPRHHILRLTWQFDIIRNDVPNKGIIRQIYDTVQNEGIIKQSKNSYRYITWVNATILHIIHMLNMSVPFGIYNVASVTDMNCYDLYKFTMKMMGISPRKYLRADNSLSPINLTPYPYALEAMGFEIIKYEDTLYNIVLENQEKQRK